MAEAASRGRNCSACAPGDAQPRGDASGTGAMPWSITSAGSATLVSDGTAR